MSNKTPHEVMHESLKDLAQVRLFAMLQESATLHKTSPSYAVVLVPTDPSQLHLAARSQDVGLSVFTLCCQHWTRRSGAPFNPKDDCQECREKQEILAELPAQDDPDNR